MTDATSTFDLATQYPGYVDRLFHLESGGDPNSVTGSNRGLGQFGPQEEARYGITDANRTSYDAQAAAVAREAAEHASTLQKALGRPPSAGELYLTHQQGAAGGPALLTASPDQPAWMAVRPYYKSDAIAQRAISGNIPSDNPLYRSDVNQISAGDFRNLWINKFEGGKGGYPSGTGTAAASVQPAAAASAQSMAGSSASLQPSAASQDTGSLTQDQTAALGQAQKALEEPGLQAAQPMQLPVNASRLRNVMAGKSGTSGIPLPPSVKQRLAALMGKMQG
jgi:hypothetical protein